MTQAAPKRRMAPDEAFALGVKRYNAGDVSEAEAVFRKVLASVSSHAGSLHYLGLIAFRKGLAEQAIDLMRRSVAIEPKVAKFHLNLGIAHEKLDAFYDAEAEYRRVVDLEPDLAKGHFSLGLALQKQERYEEAEPAYQRAIELKPDYADAHNNLGSVLQEQGRLLEAEAAYREALRLTPDDAALHNNIGGVLRASNRLDAAVSAYRDAIKIRPGYVNALNNLSSVLRHLGRHDEAEITATEAIKADADSVDAHYEYALVHKFTPDDPTFDKLHNLWRRNDLTDNLRYHLLVALGKGHNDIEQFAKAFDFYKQANALRGKDANFDPLNCVEQTQSVIRGFGSPEIAQDPQPGDRVPVFIIGLSRSGKSLAESLLAEHEAVYGAGERLEFQNATKAILDKNEITRKFPDCMEFLDDAKCREIGELYVAELAKHAPDDRFLINTLPGHNIYVGLILRALPTAKIIYCHRNALDNCLYMYFKLYKYGNEYSYDLGHLATFYRCYQETMQHWLALYGDRILSVRYEDMVSDPAATARRLYAHCGLDAARLSVSRDFKTDQISHATHYLPYLGSLTAALSDIDAIR